MYGDGPHTRIIHMRTARSRHTRRFWTNRVLTVATLVLIASCEGQSSGGAKDPVTFVPHKIICTRNVTGSSPSSITINVGAAAPVSAQYEPPPTGFCDSIYFGPTTWSSDNSAIATVIKLVTSQLAPQDGQVTGVAPGTAHLSAGTGPTTTVTVLPAQGNTITVVPVASTIQVGQGTDLTATVRDAAGNPVPGAPVTWQTANGSIASIPVNSTGTTVHVTGVSPGGPVAVTATSGTISAPAQITVAAAGGGARMAYALADQPTVPSYSPAADRSYNSSGQTIKVDRVEIGLFTVTFNGLQTPAGQTETVLVTPVGTGTGQVDCRLRTNWTSSASALVATVECLNGPLRLDSPFSILVLGSNAIAGRFAFTLADQPSAARYSPAAATTFNSTNQPVTITHGSGVGVYDTVFFGGQQRASSSDREAQLVTVLDLQSPEHCSSDPNFQTGQFMSVKCARFDGVGVDVRFTAALIGADATHVLGIARTFAPAGIVSSASFNKAGSAPPTAATSSTGVTDLTFPGLGSVVGSGAFNVQINAQTTQGRCRLHGAAGIPWSVVGADLVVHVRCFDAFSAPLDLGYTALIIR